MCRGMMTEIDCCARSETVCFHSTFAWHVVDIEAHVYHVDRNECECILAFRVPSFLFLG